MNPTAFSLGWMLWIINLVILPLELQAQEEELEIEDEEAELFFAPSEIVSSSAKHAQPIEMSPSAVTVITHEDIEASGANSLADLLRMVPGIEVTYTVSLIPSINTRRGWSTSNDAVLLLVDGQEINLELIGQPMWELVPISLEEIERIEVIRGAASSLYGANAYTGVVCVTTRKLADKTTGWARVIGGEPSRVIIDGKVSTANGNWGIFLSGGLNYAGMSSTPRIEGLGVARLTTGVNYRWSESQYIGLDAQIIHGSGAILSTITPASTDTTIATIHAQYFSDQFQAQFYWKHGTAYAAASLPIIFQGIHLASFKPLTIDSDMLDLELQWTLPKIWDPLLIIIGGSFRASFMESEDLLDDQTFNDKNSSRYHLPGIQQWEERLGIFLHSEISLTKWLVFTGGARLDYNNITGLFISPKAAMVFEIVPRQHYLRLGVTRSFRKPSFLESDIHMMAEFPKGSPVQGPDQMLFQEFMTRVGGTNNLEEERLLAFEAGYLANFFDGRLSLRLDAYYNRFTNTISMDKRLVVNDKGLLDLEKSSMWITNYPDFEFDSMGTELVVHFDPTSDLSFQFSWVHREVFLIHFDRFSQDVPKNLLTLGVRYLSKSGFIGSIYAFSRSEFNLENAQNPEGIDRPPQPFYMDNVLLLMGKLGWKFSYFNSIELEAGLKFLLPVAPSSPSWQCFQECEGGFDRQGNHWGAYALCREITLYLQGAI